MSLPTINFPTVDLPDEAEALRDDVRSFLATHRDYCDQRPIDSWSAASPEFSHLLGQKGWLGMTWPTEYGGANRSMLERYVVLEELLSAGAPVGAHWIADRQSGPLILRYGTEEQRQTILPGIVKGECFFAIGMSEPNSGSDLASIRTRADKVEGGWCINGSKIWTSFAQHCHYSIALVRTSPASDNRHAGMSQVLIDLQSKGVEIRPIKNLAGESHFNEIFFDNVFIPDDGIIGEVDKGWQQVIAELSYERSGPERFLSTFQLLVEAVKLAEKGLVKNAETVLGRLVAQLITLRQMSQSVAASLQAGNLPANEASIVKDLGTTFEQSMADVLRSVYPLEASPQDSRRYERLLADTLLFSPSFSLRGGTREVLRGIIARGLGLR